MEMKKLLRRFVDISNLNTVAKMFSSKKKDELYYRLLDFELKLEHQQKQTDELRQIVLTLSKDINSLQIEVNYLSNTKYGKGL